MIKISPCFFVEIYSDYSYFLNLILHKLITKVHVFFYCKYVMIIRVAKSKSRELYSTKITTKSQDNSKWYRSSNFFTEQKTYETYRLADRTLTPPAQPLGWLPGSGLWVCHNPPLPFDLPHVNSLTDKEPPP